MRACKLKCTVSVVVILVLAVKALFVFLGSRLHSFSFCLKFFSVGNMTIILFNSRENL